MKFPVYFPNDFPPNYAQDIKENIAVYRCTDNPLNETSFLSFIQLELPFKNNDYPYAEYGLSVNQNRLDLEERWKNSVNMREKYKYISLGAIKPGTGLIGFTPTREQPEHITWFLYEDVYPHTWFEVVENLWEKYEDEITD